MNEKKEHSHWLLLLRGMKIHLKGNSIITEDIPWLCGVLHMYVYVSTSSIPSIHISSSFEKVSLCWHEIWVTQVGNIKPYTLWLTCHAMPCHHTYQQKQKTEANASNSLLFVTEASSNKAEQSNAKKMSAVGEAFLLETCKSITTTLLLLIQVELLIVSK